MRPRCRTNSPHLGIRGARVWREDGLCDTGGAHDGTRNHQDSTCLSRTCLKWTPEGELVSEDLQRILDRLAAVDGYGADLRRCNLEEPQS